MGCGGGCGQRQDMWDEGVEQARTHGPKKAPLILAKTAMEIAGHMVQNPPKFFNKEGDDDD